MKVISNRVGDNIKMLCFVNEVSMQDLAENLGVSKTLMSFWANGIQSVPEAKIKTIAEFFSLDFKALTERDLREDCKAYLTKKKKRIFSI